MTTIREFLTDDVQDMEFDEELYSDDYVNVDWMLSQLGIDPGISIERWREAGDPRHQVEFRVDGWTVAHPLAERLDGSLFDCQVSFGHLDQPPALGRFYVEPDGTLTPVPAP